MARPCASQGTTRRTARCRPRASSCCATPTSPTKRSCARPSSSSRSGDEVLELRVDHLEARHGPAAAAAADAVEFEGEFLAAARDAEAVARLEQTERHDEAIAPAGGVG